MKTYKRKKITIEIDNLTEAEARAIEHLMKLWQLCGSWGCSRWISFYVDGDGPFRPKITIDGRKPELEPDLHSDVNKEPIRIDFDKIWHKYNKLE